MNPLVSVCMPCFNAERYVKIAIDSILEQSWDSLEIIIVNDGSTDASELILDSIADSRVRVIHQENRGQCAAANRALAEAQGTLIKFFDADDKIVIADVGHYESEQYTTELIYDILNKKIPNFAVRLSKENTNPVNYL